MLAFVVAAPGEARGAQAAEAIARWALAEMAYYKVPGWIAFVDALPVTATQKLMRGELRALAERVAATPDCHDVRALKKRVA